MAYSLFRHTQNKNNFNFSSNAKLSDPIRQAEKLTIIIPAYNEERTIKTTIDRILSLQYEGEREIIVVDDGSADETSSIINRLADDRLVIMRHRFNQGKGAAIRTGLEHASGEFILIQDADFEYNPDDLPLLINVLKETGAAACYGSRFKGECKNMLWVNRAANYILSWMATLLYGQRITDEATGYKLFRADALRSFSLNAKRFEFCPEVTAKLLRQGCRIVEVPIHYAARTKNEGKKIGWKDGLQAIWILLYYRIHE